MPVSLLPGLIAAIAQPPPVTVPPAPPVFPRVASPYEAALAMDPVPIEVRVSAGRESLWEGTLRVNPVAGANITQNRSEAAPVDCAVDRRRGASVGNSLRLSLRVIPDREGEILFAVDVNWTRPGSADQCPSGGSRGIHLQQNVAIASGQSVTLRGDADLTVELRRRPNR
jgi:hypothetical protein